MTTQRRRWIATITLATMLGSQCGIARSGAQPPTAADTVSPIKHVIVIIGREPYLRPCVRHVRPEAR